MAPRDDHDLRRLASREDFDGVERRQAEDAMAEVLSEVPPTQLTPLSDGELVTRAVDRLKRPGSEGPFVGGGGN